MMKYLNLHKDFTPLGGGATYIEHETFTFSGGEPHIKIKEELENNDVVTITTRMNSWDDLGALAVAISALHELRVYHLYLYMPYFPGGRQDRVMVSGEPLTVKVYADIINDMGFSGVTIFDPHSDVTAVLIDEVKVNTNHNFIHSVLETIERSDNVFPILVSPDAGANKKVGALAKALGRDTVIKCDKTREVSTGKITDFDVYKDDIKGQPCIIVDDICDGGGTFVGIAQELKEKNAGDLYLAVSHGTFSKGVSHLQPYFKAIFTTDSIRNLTDGVLTFSHEELERNF